MTAHLADGVPARIPTRITARITDAPLDVIGCLTAVTDDAAGGQGLFVGTIRADDQGRAVRGLSYEAHPTAEAVLREVCARHADPVLAIAVEHRVGDLVVGDVAVVVAVSAVHRAAALDTTRALIDVIKAEVPIWKHQLFADGTDEWVGLDQDLGCAVAASGTTTATPSSATTIA
jgi:molybdopterin synthase catalytic subunit